MKQMVDVLNKARDSYYNDNIEIMSNKAYDEMFDQLVEMEKTYNKVFSNSPTQNVGYEVKSKFSQLYRANSCLNISKNIKKPCM